MTIAELSGKIQTVLGIIDPDELGVTLPHEHLVCDGTAWFVEPSQGPERDMAHRPVSIENLWWVRYHWPENLDNLLLRDEDEAIREVERFKRAGGRSVVEMSNNGLGRDPEALARISRATGLHILMGSGYYLGSSLPADFDRRTDEEIADEIVRDITVGVGGTGVRAGYIGEIGCSYPLHPWEKKSLKASVRAQQMSGANLNVHPGQAEEEALEIVQLLEGWGADLCRTTIDHIDRAVRSPENRLRLAEKGLVLEYDLFGREGYYPLYLRRIDLPNDNQRINEIMELIDAGFINQILISQDIWNKHQRTAYGGWGYDHILRNAVPMMLAKGMTKEQIHTIMVDNPKRVFTFL